MSYYAGEDNSKRVFTHPSAEDLKEKLASNLENTKNPFTDFYIWTKGEFLDCEGM